MNYSLVKGEKVKRLWRLRRWSNLKNCLVKSLYSTGMTIVVTAVVVSLAFSGDGLALSDMKSKRYNRLIREKSPYLLQHAENPVDWYPWGEEAFEKARRKNKPIFLSIGYSTCHWCHVMEEESFSDPEVARLMNEVFVSIKVDREERPDIDGLYMTVCQMMDQSCGWPLNIIMTPDKKPFFAASYIPKVDKFGRTGMVNLIPSINEVWKTRHDAVLSSSEEISDYLRQMAQTPPGEELGLPAVKLTFNQLSAGFDGKNGGFGTAPKFPRPHNLMFLLRYWKRTGDGKALEMVEKTLQSIRKGGIYDHIGFGVHRYSTDERWFMPHFEKMIYDQALLSMTYTEAFQATGKKEYEKTAREIFTYVLREMTSDKGVFFTAEDADSEGEEGKFYFWKESEIRNILSREDADLAARVFNIERGGNLAEGAGEARPGTNILHLKRSLKELSAEIKVGEDELYKRLEKIRKPLFVYREKRIHPYKDDKVLTDLNGLMIAALAKGTQALGDPAYAEAAKRAADFILGSMRDSKGRLFHRYRDGEVAIKAHIDDYAFMVWGLIELYEATFESRYLKAALDLNRDMVAQFWDDRNGGFYTVADDGEKLLARQKEIYDGAIPSGNSVAMANLLRLGRMTAAIGLEDKAAKIGRAFSGAVSRAPSAYTQLMAAVDFSLGPSYEVVIVGDSKEKGTGEMLAALIKEFIPNKVVLLRQTDQKSPEIDRLAPFVKHYIGIDKRSTAFVCRDYKCNLPTTDPEKMLKLLKQNQR